MMGMVKKAKAAASGGAAAGVSEGLLAASAVGVAGAALVKTPASNQIKEAVGFGPSASLAQGAITDYGVSSASPPGQDLMPGGAVGGPEGMVLGSAMSEATLGAAIGGGAASIPIFAGPGDGRHSGAVFNTKSGSGKAMGSKMLGQAKQAGKGAANMATKTASSGSFIRGAGILAGAAAGASLLGDMVDRVSRRVVQAGTPASQRLPAPKRNSKSARRTEPTTGVSRNAGRGPGARGDPAMTGSTVLALHKTGGGGGVLT